MTDDAQTITAADREALRDLVRRFVSQEVLPHIDAWEEAGAFPRALYARAGELGLLGLGFPEAFGGTPGDHRSMIVLVEEFMQAASGGLIAGLLSHGIGLPPIVHFGSDALKSRLVPPILAGELICALAITAPSGVLTDGVAYLAARTSPTSRPRLAATATTTCSTARRSSSPRGCAPT